MAGMKQIGFTLMLFVVVLSPLAAVCQRSPRVDKKADWTAVQILERGVALDVKWTDGRSSYCIFNGATQDTLFCDQGSWAPGREYSVMRSQVKLIRLERSPNQIVKTSAAVGAIAGFALPNQEASERIIGALAGGAAGVLAGCVISLPAAFIPGRLIYRQPNAGSLGRHAQFRRHEPGATTSGRR